MYWRNQGYDGSLDGISRDTINRRLIASVKRPDDLIATDPSQVNAKIPAPAEKYGFPLNKLSILSYIWEVAGRQSDENGQCETLD